MGAQERTEDALRAMHILIANAEYAPGSDEMVMIEKEEAQSLLKELGECLYAMLDESELTKSSHAQAERSRQKEATLTEERARKKAEDIYAGSLMYSDRALSQVSKIVQQASDQIEKIHTDLMSQIEQEKNNIRKDQYELKGQLNDLKDTQEYLRLIEEENKRIAKEEQSGEFTDESDTPSYENVKPEIHVNPAFFKGEDLPDDAVIDGIDDDDDDTGTRKKGLFSVFKK